MDISTVLHFLAGPVIGGAIGYCTNWIAIKMLFRPRHEVKIGNYTLPFTPGIIPKRKDRLAREIGETVAEKMFTPEDVESIFLSDGMKQAVANSVMASLSHEGQPYSLSTLMDEACDPDDWELCQQKMDELMERKAYQTIMKADMAERISYESRKLLVQISRENNLVRVLGSSRIESISDYMGRHLQKYARDNVDTLIMPLLRDEVAKVMVMPYTEMLEEVDLEESRIREMIGNAYERFMHRYKDDIVKMFDIASLTEQRIIDLQAEEVEALVNRTIHREMQSVINLGAVLGIVIGLVNSFI